MNWGINRIPKYVSRLAAIILTIIVMHGCAPQMLRTPTPSSKSTLRVGILEYQEQISFRALDDLSVRLNDGSTQVFGKAGDSFTAIVQQGRPAKTVVCLLVKTCESSGEAQREVSTLTKKNVAAVVRKEQQLGLRNGRLQRQILHHVCLKQTFASTVDAKAYQQRVNTVHTRLFEYIDKYPDGMVVLRNSRTGKTVKAKGYLKIAQGRITMNVPTGNGFHYENTVSRTYGPDINLVVDSKALLTVINEVPLEQYISSVIASEMNSRFPLEALKAQAVTARSFTMSKIGKQHPMKPFDLCDDVHCQVYSGLTRTTKRTDYAASATAGYVLMNENQICETVYHSVCGGHTENNENVWQGNPRTYLRGRFDVPPSMSNIPTDFLQHEDNVVQWISSFPNVYCNANSGNVPEFLEYTKKYFRWNVSVSQAEIRQNVRKNTGQDVGSILSIVPIKRGISGRQMQIRIIGTDGTIVVEGDLPIRRALSNQVLYSSCFIVTFDRVGNGVPSEFKIAGAGWGHGVGMCQTGAAKMALNGATYSDILQHYYQNTSLRKIN